MKQKFTLFIMFLFSLSAYSQQMVSSLRGNIIDVTTQTPLSGVSVMLKNQKQSTITDTNGEFVFHNIPIGDNTLIINSASTEESVVPIHVPQAQDINLGKFVVISLRQETFGASNDYAVATLDESVMDFESDFMSQTIATLALLSDDPYLSITSFPFSTVRFRPRGYMAKYEKTYLSGIEFNDQIRGLFNHSSIGVMNDVTRNRDILNFQQPGSFCFGNIAGAQDINLRPSSFTKGGKVTASYTNRNYYLRTMASYSTGLMDNGWAVTGLLGFRYADQGFVDGTFYRNVSYFLGVEKQWEDGKHSLSLTTFGSPAQRAQESANVMEVYELTGTNFYNSYWGYQDGERRSSRIVTTYDPTAVLSYTLKPGNDSRLTVGFGVHNGRYGNTDLNWFRNAADPRPDYYRYLPSYQGTEDARRAYTELWQNNDPSITQINWDKLYESNYLGKLVGDSSALYIVEERRSDLFEMNFNTIFDAKVGENINMSAGMGLRSSNNMVFNTVNDLLGASYVLDVDKYGERDFPGDENVRQNDLNNPNRKVVVGDRFAYDYNLYARSANVWLQNQHQYNKFDIYYGFKLTYTAFQREGNMKNGRNPLNSYGKGKRHEFTDQMLKAGFVYKIDGRHFIVGDAMYATQAPLPFDAYISPRVKDTEIPNLQSEKYWAADLGYMFSMPALKGRVSVFQANFYDQTQKSSFFNEIYQTYVHHILSNVEKVHRGIELGVSWKATENWSFDFGGTASEYFYSTRPDGTISYENNRVEDLHEKVYIKNFYVGGTPQLAGTFRVNYFINYWFLSANVNGFGRSYLDPSPIRRIASSLIFNADTEQEYLDKVDEFTRQNKLKGGLTLDVTIGKMFFLKNGHTLSCNLNLGNVLNNTNIQTGGYEQGRIDLVNFDLNKFPPKFYFMQGINAFLNLGYRF